MNFLKKNLVIPLVVFMLMAVPLISFGQATRGESEDPIVKVVNPIKSEDLNGFIQTILEGIMKIAIPIIALAIIYSGFLFVTAQGNSEKLGDAKKALFNSLIGATILLGAWAIAKLISETVFAL